jgi:hypothetical protein
MFVSGTLRKDGLPMLPRPRSTKTCYAALEQGCGAQRIKAFRAYTSIRSGEIYTEILLFSSTA